MSLAYKMGQMLCGLRRFMELRVANWLFRDCVGPRMLKRPLFGSTLVADVSRSASQQLLFLQGERAIPERWLVTRLMKPAMHVVDVGANIGYYLSMYESMIGTEGRVTCIEPSPENLKELHANIRENGWTNVTVHECAVGNETATVGLRDGINSGVVDVSEGVFQTMVRPLDELVSDRCDFLKIDVDGYEWLVLQGARQVIERDRPILFLEYHPQLVGRHGGSLSEVLGFLRPYYTSIEYFDVSEFQSLPAKFAIRYLNCDPVRQISVDGLPESTLHAGRLYGTFWILCRTETIS